MLYNFWLIYCCVFCYVVDSDNHGWVENHVKLMKGYRSTIGIENLCFPFIHLMGQRSFMKGDDYRYLTEFKRDVDRKEDAPTTLLAYISIHYAFIYSKSS